ncbi:hypothetical protein [Orrella marina]|uniref:Uncharacterized protein n=1 Tax=Orrella marina TaxID=2163011 RepID=A0A2R4XF83_9BURK|nr:hypothetical protein [Orrella marina]AWB32462.1 hypothetical protein DBV39_00630 [Orrella marina]
MPSTAEENKNDAVFAPINQDATPLAVQIVLPSTTAAPTDCPRTSTKCFQVTATQQWRTFFLQIFGISTLTTNAVATAISGEVIPPDEAGAVPAILALSRDQAGVSFTGGTVTISGDVNSNSDIVRTGSTSVTVNPLPKTENSGTLNAVGVITGFNSLPAARRKQGIASLFADPCAGALRRQDMEREANFASCLPPPSFPSNCSSSNPFTIPAGTYCSLAGPNNQALSIPTQCTVRMRGNYYVRDGLNIESNPNTVLDGEGVFIYNKTGAVQFLLGGRVTLTPATSGTKSGVLMFHDGVGDVSFQTRNSGATGARIDGIFYAPRATLSFSANHSGWPYSSTGIVAAAVQTSGSTLLTVNTPPGGACSNLKGGGLLGRVKLVR